MTTDDQDDHTPREHVVSNSERMQHAARRTGTMPVITPAGELRSTLHDLTDQNILGRVERLERDAEAQRLDSALAEASRRTWRWILGFGVPVLLGGMFTVLLYAVDKIAVAGERAGESRAEIRALGKLIDLLESHISELRRHAGLDGKPISITWRDP